MSETMGHPAHSPLLPNQIRSAVPNRPPDFHYPELDNTNGWQQLSAAKTNGRPFSYGGIWLPTPDESGYAYVHEHTEAGRRGLPKIVASLVRDVEEAKQWGLREIIDAVGVKTSVAEDLETQTTWHEMSFPDQQTFCDNVDKAADRGVVHVRFAVNSHPGNFNKQELAESLGGKQRMLIAPANIANPTIGDFEHYTHDILFHALGYLSLDPDSAQRLLKRSSTALSELRAGNYFPAMSLLLTLEAQIAIAEILACAKSPIAKELRYLNEPGKEPASKLVHERLLRLRLAENPVLEPSV